MRSIRGRLLFVLLAGLPIVLAAGGAALYLVAKVNLTRQFDAALRVRAHTLAALVKLEPEGLVFETSDAPQATMTETYFELRTIDQRLLKRSANLGSASLPQRDLIGDFAIDDAPLPAAARGRVIWFKFRPRVDPDDWPGRELNQVEAPPLIVAAALERSPIDRASVTLLTALCAVGALVALVAGALVVLGVRWGLAPLDQLRRQLAGIAGDSIRTRLDDHAIPAELAPVHQELNAMLGRVAQTLDRERSFADAAAHELRSPLTELRTAAEVAIRWPDLDRALEALRQILAVGAEMERLVESLLMISRGNSHTVEDARSEAPLDEIVNGHLHRLDEAIQVKALTVEVDLNGGPRFAVPPASMEIIIRNLIDNAVRYTSPRGAIVIRQPHRLDQSPELIIENGPVQLHDEDIPRLFEPFWRSDRSRSDREHVGLGLTVVERIGRASGLRISASLIGERLRMQIVAAQTHRQWI